MKYIVIKRSDIDTNKLSNQPKKQKGITLIALVVTIIMLLILAGITLSMTSSGEGLFGKAEKAAQKYNEKSVQENETIEALGQLIDNYSSSSNPNIEVGEIITYRDTTFKVVQVSGTQITMIATSFGRNKNLTGMVGESFEDFQTRIISELNEECKDIYQETQLNIKARSATRLDETKGWIDQTGVMFWLANCKEEGGLYYCDAYLGGQDIPNFGYLYISSISTPISMGTNICPVVEISSSLIKKVDGSWQCNI